MPSPSGDINIIASNGEVEPLPPSEPIPDLDPNVPAPDIEPSTADPTADKAGLEQAPVAATDPTLTSTFMMTPDPVAGSPSTSVTSTDKGKKRERPASPHGEDAVESTAEATEGGTAVGGVKKKGKKTPTTAVKNKPKAPSAAMKKKAAAEAAEALQAARVAEASRLAEDRYLAGLKEGFDGLRDAVPALRALL